MIYIFTALYCEAHVFIEHFHLKKVLENTRFQQFASESGQILLTISGVGEIAAAVCVSSVCTKRPPGQGDFLLNAGTCAGTAEQGSIFLIHKLMEHETGKTFYPDILYRHGFQESALITGMLRCKKRPGDGIGMQDVQRISAACLQDMSGTFGVCLYDMEGAAVYQAGSYFFGPHQMIFLKMISDCGEEARQSGEWIRHLMEIHKESLCTFIEQRLWIMQNECQSEKRSVREQNMQRTEYSERWVDQLCADLHGSKTMCNSLRQYIRYAALAGINCSKAVQEMYQENKLPCKVKKDGKQCLEELKQRLLFS